ncbi:MAG: OB-fold nucleic acid binding domain-containing protein, partial [Anaerolineales bacterium]|nr:OB-fold nucleic acid binding domain-containing protein [Anaerolineales bacterium]
GYIRRMHGQEAVEYTHPALEPIFKETYGYPVYQEQLMRAVMDLAGYSAPEADDLRKAISKKLKDKLLEHRKKFVEGSVSKGIPQEKAEKIFDDWEEFARYGFNKAHAADYGVIAVQTAYLKAHYPVEYMTALLSVTRNDTEKVALYVADCRRMGIDVRPPDVNASDWDFTIEDERDEAGKIKSAAIRFGLGAVKNVGHGPVEAILAGREGRPFQDLNDFAQRVDLRQVGKRSLESLVRVGALDQFGPRNALLASLDIILSVSTASFRAAEMGQMTLFGEHTGVNEAIVLPRSVAEVSRREMLNWEKELIGLYVSDHPLSPVMNEITQVITHFSGQLSEASPEETVRVAGLVTRVRHYQSKAGNAMAFVTLEDVQGKIELVIFPKVWAQAAKLVEYDKVILVEGRVEGEGGDPKVIAQRVSSELKITSAAGEKTTSGINRVGAKVRREAAKPGAPVRSAAPVQVGSEPPAQEEEVYEPPVEAVEETWERNCPPPPEPFPDGWAPTAAVGKETIASEAAQVEGAPGTNPPDPLVELNPEAAPEAPQEEVEPVTAAEIIAGEAVEEAPTAQAPAIGARTGVALEAAQEQAAAEPPPFILPPAPASAEGNVHMITVFLRTTGDKTHDVLRMRRIHHNIASFPGNDRFAFWVYERGRNYLVEFPNESTGVCQELLEKLGGMVGPENVHIEKIRFQ